MAKISLYSGTTNRQEIFTIMLLVIFIGLAEYVGWMSPVSAVVQRGTNPLMAFETEVVRVVRWPFESLFTGYRSAEQLRLMQVRYAAQSAELHELVQLRRENQTLREMLENSDRTLDDRKIATPVVSLAYPAVASGQSDGILEGNMVTFQDTLLGVISDVSEHQSRVDLLSRQEGVPVLAKTESGIQGVIVGDGKRVKLTEVPHNVSLAEGERVVTVGQEGVRRDVLIGTIRNIEVRPSAPTQTAIIEQLVSFYDAPVVEVW